MIYESGGGCPKKIPPFPSLTAGGSHKFSPVGPFPPSLAPIRAVPPVGTVSCSSSFSISITDPSAPFVAAKPRKGFSCRMVQHLAL